MMPRTIAINVKDAERLSTLPSPRGEGSVERLLPEARLEGLGVRDGHGRYAHLAW